MSKATVQDGAAAAKIGLEGGSSDMTKTMKSRPQPTAPSAPQAPPVPTNKDKK